jgi:hypothetical protein
VPTAPGWGVASLLTVGDMAQTSPYVMVGIPDGLGALAGKVDPVTGEQIADGAYMTVFMNHEIRPGLGAVRAHGQTGAFVSAWTINLNSLAVKTGEDLITQLYTWNAALGQYVFTTGPGAQLNRLCSADLPAASAFYNPSTGRGFNGRIFMNGEEAGAEGRACAHVVTGPERGRSYELPYLGRLSWENSVAHPNAKDKTIVVGLNDSTPGQLYVYVGTKRHTGNPVERAGLAGGSLFGIAVSNGGGGYANGPVAIEGKGAINGAFTLVDLSDVAVGSGATLQTASVARGITGFARPEDGSWDTRDPRVFYFVTTGATVGGAAQSSRLYKLTFDGVQNPTGGTIQLVLDSAALVGTDGQTARMFDNVTVSGNGDVLVQEDPGNTPYIAKVWSVNPASGAAVQVFESDRNRFLPGGSSFLTQDEENSGVIEVTRLVRSARWYETGRRYYLGVLQAHYTIPGELVEGGQFYIMVSPK